ncbi:hypothetical protein PQX77_018114 [Marasmius sp. AFHP31]|nr:hypothetical protein PQX77_018114 [Marasmius sp. AFHP31]
MCPLVPLTKEIAPWGPENETLLFLGPGHYFFEEAEPHAVIGSQSWSRAELAVGNTTSNYPTAAAVIQQISHAYGRIAERKGVVASGSRMVPITPAAHAAVIAWVEELEKQLALQMLREGKKCHNCGKKGHFKCDCWEARGGKEGHFKCDCWEAGGGKEGQQPN